MGHLPATLSLPKLQETLIVFLEHVMLACAHIDYRLVGTGAALLHGISLPAADIDILVGKRQDVDAVGAALTSFRCLEAPAWLPDMRQYYGNYEVNGVEVGFSTVEIESDTDTIETFGRGPWEHYTLIPCGHYAVPVVALELRLITELYRNRPDRYKPIIHHMLRHGCDLEFIQRGIRAAGLPQTLQENIRTELQNAPFLSVPQQKR